MEQEFKQVKNSMNAHLFPAEGEKNTGKSQTTPDMAMTVTEMLGRARRNMPVSVSSRKVYYDEEYVDPQLWRMDNMDKADYLDQLAAQYEEEQRKKKARLEEYQSKMAEKQKEDAEIRAYIKARNEAKNGQSGAAPETGSGATGSTNIT